MGYEIRKYTRKRLKPGFFSGFSRKFSVTNWMIILNVIVFFVLYVLLSLNYENIVYMFMIQANAFFEKFYFWSVFTSMFMHVNIGHLLANCVSLFFIGNFVERLIGRKRFFWLYVLSGIFAGLFYVTLSYFFGFGIGARIFVSPETFALGASGAVFALLGVLAILTPKNRVYLIVGPIIAIIAQAVFANLVPGSNLIPIFNLLVTVYIVFAIFAIFSFNRTLLKWAVPWEMPFWLLPIIAIIPLVIIGLFVELPIGNTAHLGGLLIGMIYAYYLKKKYKKKTMMIAKYFGK